MLVTLNIDKPEIPACYEDVGKIFGSFKYRDTDDGNIKILGDWKQQNLCTVILPIVGKKTIHRKMVNVFMTALCEIAVTIGMDDGTSSPIIQFGTWAPRHMMHNPKRKLSLHSWGIACDVNWKDNKVGTAGNMDDRIIGVFKSHGFTYGGDWAGKSRDPMHFQYCR